MKDYPVREKSLNGQPPETNLFARRCRSCFASFILTAAGRTGERGLWDEWHWYCSRECLARGTKGEGSG